MGKRTNGTTEFHNGQELADDAVWKGQEHGLKALEIGNCEKEVSWRLGRVPEDKQEDEGKAS